MEKNPSSEHSSPEQKKQSPRDSLLKFFNRYRARPDIPKYSYAEQGDLGKKSEEAQQRFLKEKTVEAKRASEIAAKQFLESKEDKKHISTIWAPIAAAQYFLRSEDANYIPEENRADLLQKIDGLMKNLEEARKKENISDELVREVLSFMAEVEKQLN